jgi:hypothetical protein
MKGLPVISWPPQGPFLVHPSLIWRLVCQLKPSQSGVKTPRVNREIDLRRAHRRVGSRMRVWWHGDAIRVSGLLLEHMWAMVGHVKSAVFVLVTTMAIGVNLENCMMNSDGDRPLFVSSHSILLPSSVTKSPLSIIHRKTKRSFLTRTAESGCVPTFRRVWVARDLRPWPMRREAEG